MKPDARSRSPPSSPQPCSRPLRRRSPATADGHGPPAWAGGGGGATAKGKPAWAGKGQEKKAEKAVQKEQRRAAREATGDEAADAPKHATQPGSASSSAGGWGPTHSPSLRHERHQGERFREVRLPRSARPRRRHPGRRDTPPDGQTADGGETAGDEASEGLRADVIAVLEEFFLALRQLVL